MITVLTGTNDFMRRAELRRLTDEFIDKYGDFGVEKIDASEVEMGRLLESVASLPFLAERRMIILSNSGMNKSLVEDVNKLIDAVSDTTDLIIDEQKFDKRLNLYKTLKKRTDLKEFKDLDEPGLIKWLVAEAQIREGKISQADAKHLIDRTGVNQMLLSNELDKLLAYSSDVNRQSIDLLVEPSPSSSMFDLLDAAFAGNQRRAMELYKDQRAQQVEPLAVMGMIAWQLHVFAVVKFNERQGADNIASSAKLNPYVVRKTMSALRGMDEGRVRELTNRAVTLDARLKSETIDADDAVQHFLLCI